MEDVLVSYSCCSRPVDELSGCAIAGFRYKQAEEWVEMIGREKSRCRAER